MKQTHSTKHKQDYCPEHNPASKKMGYVEWHLWAERKIKQGHKQRKCPKCGRWLFKCEM